MAENLSLDISSAGMGGTMVMPPSKYAQTQIRLTVHIEKVERVLRLARTCLHRIGIQQKADMRPEEQTST